jgi:hypothetical protein
VSASLESAVSCVNGRSLFGQCGAGDYHLKGWATSGEEEYHQEGTSIIWIGEGIIYLMEETIILTNMKIKSNGHNFGYHLRYHIEVSSKMTFLFL